MPKKPFSKPELLSPAGDLLRAKTAILFGADAVYLGGKKYSLRSRAGNFTMEDIRKACEFARAHGSRIHVTVNEIPHEGDLDGIEDYLKELEDCGVTAVIAASPTILRLAKETTGLEAHCSTQMSITNSAAARVMHDLTGCDRVVLARECTMAEIEAINDTLDLETEVFIHGGMCVNYSGRCILSNHMTLRDANRGGCAQSCRWHYRLYENDSLLSKDACLFTMGSKDLSAGEHLYSLMHAGVGSLKIEGRMKTEFYVASITHAYRRMIDEIYETKTPLSKERLAYYRHEIAMAQNRETFPGNYAGIGGSSSIIYHENSDANVNHAFLGRVIQSTSDSLILETRNPFELGDVVEVMEPGKELRSFTITAMKDEELGVILKSRTPMRHVEIFCGFPVAEGALLRKGNV
ncbi:MAG: U32 family peptidase [Solobacterium sp.]|nr:U32 family peptidase [Solobacterium sp.]